MTPLTDSDLEGRSWPFSQSLCLHVFCLFVFRQRYCSVVGFPGYRWLCFLLSPTLHAYPDL